MIHDKFQFLSAYDLSPVFSEEDFQHWFLPRDTIVDCYVIQDESTGAITDLMSYYALPSTVMNHPTHKSLRAAYSFYNVSTKTPWNELIGDALVLAKKVGASRVSRVVGGWAKRAKKCCTPSRIEISKSWSKVCSGMLWDRLSMAES